MEPDSIRRTKGFSIYMDLLRNIRNDRVRLRRKQSLERKAFDTVSCIVKKYGLGESFPRLLDQDKNLPARDSMEFNKIKAKAILEFPPFCLLSQQEYGVAVTITNKVDNPYLPFAHSPEELLLCSPLYEANPWLNPEHLSRYHFETLLLCQRAKEELARLEREIEKFDGAVAQDCRVEESRGESSPRRSLQDRIKQLRTFIASIGDTES